VALTTLPALIELSASGRGEEYEGQECNHSTSTAHPLHGEIDILRLSPNNVNRIAYKKDLAVVFYVFPWPA